MKIGDKVRVTKGEYKGLVGTVGNIMGEKVRIDNSRVDVFLWYNKSDLEPVIEHKFKVGDKVRIISDNVISKIIEIDDRQEANYIYHVEYEDSWWREYELAPVSDHMTADELAELITSTPTEKMEVNLASGTADNTNQRTASGVDPYTAEIGDPVIKYWYDSGYKDGHDKGYRTGMQAVITNIKRFLKEITP